jgi:hypothetical protein
MATTCAKEAPIFHCLFELCSKRRGDDPAEKSILAGARHQRDRRRDT